MSSYLESNSSLIKEVSSLSYSEQFKLVNNSQNDVFIKHAYQQDACKASEIVCFSVKDGMLKSKSKSKSKSK